MIHSVNGGNSRAFAAATAIVIVSALCVSATLNRAVAEPEAKFTWMLPRTVIDATITYTFESCDDQSGVKVNIKPTLISRPIPDTLIGAVDNISSSSLQSWSSDSSVTIRTFQNSHILQSIGATPVSQAATIANSILTSVGKIVALALGVSPLTAGNVTHDKCGSAWTDKDKIAKLRAALVGVQQAIVDAPNDEQRKAATARADAYQSVLAAWSTASAAAHTLTLQATIDPGFTPIEVLDPTKRTSTKPTDINPNGLIATIVPTQEQIEGVGWIKKGLPIDAESRERLRVNIYLDFGQTLPIAQASVDMARAPIRIDESGGDLYREVAYIPAYVYSGVTLANWNTGNRGLSTTWPGVSRVVTENDAKKNQLLAPAQRLPFPQYGRAMGLPVTAGFLKNQDWSITFQESGEITETKFVNKSLGAAAAGALNSALGTANAIAAEERSARLANSETTRLKTENDELQARINNLNLQEQLQKLLAKQTSPSQAQAGVNQ